jgi:ArsR family transcriptional regulator, arsenate/arsenite/antimonite-responsive transcriptional repressor
MKRFCSSLMHPCTVVLGQSLSTPIATQSGVLCKNHPVNSLSGSNPAKTTLNSNTGPCFLVLFVLVNRWLACTCFFLNPNHMNTSKTAELEIQSETLLRASFIFEAAIHPVCQRMLRLLDEEERLTAGAISQKMSLEQAVCSNYLSILHRADLVLIEREGRQAWYVVNNAMFDQLFACAEVLFA